MRCPKTSRGGGEMVLEDQPPLTVLPHQDRLTGLNAVHSIMAPASRDGLKAYVGTYRSRHSSGVVFAHSCHGPWLCDRLLS